MTIVLRHQVEASEQAATEIESEIEGQRISLCYEVQSLLKGLVANAQDLADFIESIRHSLVRGEARFDPEPLKEIDALSRRIESTFGRANHLVQSVESFSNCTLEGQDKFHLEWEKLKAMVCFSLDSIITANGQADRGEGRELADVMHELLH